MHRTDVVPEPGRRRRGHCSKWSRVLRSRLLPRSQWLPVLRPSILALPLLEGWTSVLPLICFRAPVPCAPGRENSEIEEIYENYLDWFMCLRLICRFSCENGSSDRCD